MLRYFVAVLTAVTCLAADPAIAIQIRMISAESDRVLIVEVTDDQGQPVSGATSRTTGTSRQRPCGGHR